MVFHKEKTPLRSSVIENISKRSSMGQKILQRSSEQEGGLVVLYKGLLFLEHLKENFLYRKVLRLSKSFKIMEDLHSVQGVLFIRDL